MSRTHQPDSAEELDREVRNQAGEWIAANWRPDLTLRQWWAALAESGWGFPTWPVELFGRGLPAEAGAAVRAELAAAGAIGPASGCWACHASPGSIGMFRSRTCTRRSVATFDQVEDECLQAKFPTTCPPLRTGTTCLRIGWRS